jgi:hypothetical protein
MPPHKVFRHLAEHEFPEVAYALFQKAKAGDGQAQRLITEQLLGKRRSESRAGARRRSSSIPC